ncbi:hypothetical protein GM661_09120 [Iocasia frigidifontis]|uniref:Uncharacterized protein n=1 Tax=Iocasia fonsfrigidae TaxID=2682810 RepID=A0A8A7K8P9_9FIRM|nr:hypothetical protein [Iocasia fonsfrigidae]QTL98126.1 hypothetical protein GM661_09120 [Iocasia fonsfrigidae]
MIEKKSIKKTLILLISLILLITLAACSNDETTLNQNKEKNEQITKARLAREEAEKGNSNNVNYKMKLIQLHEKSEFVLTKEIHSNGDGSLKGTVEYDYDTHGNLLSITYIDKDNTIIGNIKYKYNDRDLVIERVVNKQPNYFANRWVAGSCAWGMVKEVQEFPRYFNGIAKYSYNEDDQLIEYLEKDKETGEKLRTVRREYYPSGNLKYDYEWRETGYECEIFYDDVYIRHAYEWVKRVEREEGKNTITIKQDYDEKGNIIKGITIITDSDGNVVSESEDNYEYDEKGRNVRFSCEIISIEYEYDEKGNEIRQVKRDSAGNVDDIYELEYDDKGNMIKSITKNPDGSIFSYSQSYYDKYNNRIKIIRKKDGNIEKKYEYVYKIIP